MNTIRLGARQVFSGYCDLHPEGWKITNILAWIERRSGEYDDIEQMHIQDPYVEGWKMRLQGKRITDITKEVNNQSRHDREEQFRLRVLGWKRCDRELAND